MDVFGIVAVILLSFLSFANGANDVSKAIATLAGAKVTSMRRAVLWGVVWTLAGSLSGFYFGLAIIKNITQNIYTIQPEFSFPMSVAIGLAPTLWVFLATWRKWPVSTTHAVVGGLLGAGVTALGVSGIAWGNVLQKIGLPLLVSPFLAIGLAYAFGSGLQKTARAMERMRLCLAPVPKLVIANQRSNLMAEASHEGRCLVCDCESVSARMNHNIGISVNQMHWLTSGLLSFSRGLNDTPKLIAVVLPFLLAGSLGKEHMGIMFLVSGLAMAAGGFLVGSRIAKVLGFEVTPLNHTQGFAANAVATVIVLFASKLGLPVSTTHVSSCSIMGLGMADKRSLNKDTVQSMLFAWLITVPVAALYAFMIYHMVAMI